MISQTRSAACWLGIAGGRPLAERDLSAPSRAVVVNGSSDVLAKLVSTRPGTNMNRRPGLSKRTWSSTAAPPWPGNSPRPCPPRTVHGWTENVAVRNGRTKGVLEAMDEIVDRLPFPVVGLDTGGESINHTLINRARRPRHLLHRLPALKVQRQKSRRAEVRRRRPPARLRLPLRHGSRAETPRHPLRPRPAEPLHRHHKNKRLALQQTRQEDPHQRQATDRYQRLIDSGILTGAKAAELAHLMAITNPAGLICRITTIQTQLIALAPAKTSVLEASPTGLFT